MVNLFDFNGDGETSFTEEMFGTMLIMGAFDENAQNDDVDLYYDDEGEGFSDE